MRLGKITGTVTATMKSAGLIGKRLMIVDLVDAQGKVTDAAVIAVDTCGSGQGDSVLVTTGSAARVSSETSGVAIDAAIIAIIDSVDQIKKTNSSRGKK